jgi:hypothetical protein
VPERGRPETTTIGGPNRIRRTNCVRTVIKSDVYA